MAGAGGTMSPGRRSIVKFKVLRNHARMRQCTILFYLLLLLQAQVQEVMSLSHDAVTAYAAYTDDTDSPSVAVGRSAHEPKFGERLLPLRKKNNANGLNATKFGSAASFVNVTEKPVNSLLNKSNYVVSVDGNTEKVPPELYTLDGELMGGSQYQQLTKPREAKQLNRREDINVLEASAASLSPAHESSISKADRLIEMSTEFFVVPSSAAPPTDTQYTMNHTTRFGPKSRNVPTFIQPPAQPPRSVLIVAPKSTTAHSSNVTPPTIVFTHPPLTSGLRKEPWVVPVLVLASLTMLMMGAFEIFVLFKAWRTSPSRRHLFLGQMLLLGLFACAALGAIITAQPTLLTCGAIRFGVGVAYALVFAALLVKCVFLISLNGGVYLPAPYQGLLLLFAVLIQVAVGAQWLLTQPPEIYTISVPIISAGASLLGTTVASRTSISGDSSDASNFAALFHPTNTYSANDLYTRVSSAGTVVIPLCKTQFSELLFSLIYIIFLIVFVAVLAIKSRGIRDNYREATYIGLAIGGAIPIWLGWMLCGLAVAERHKDACIAFGLVATSATVFLVMFMPKGRQLAAMGKEGLYVEDREEQFSSLSRAGSGYSPSFFHFKPLKYGMMGGGGGMQNSTSQAGNMNGKHCSGGGDRVALVTAAPPSYTRMYHYFPAPLTTHPFCFYPQPPPPPPPQLSAPHIPTIPPPTMTQLPSPPTLKQLGNSLSSMTQAQFAHTLRYPGLFIRPDETNLYTTLEPTLSSNPNVYFQRGGAVHPGMMY